MSTLKELREIRIDKLNKLKLLGINPYPSKSNKSIDNFTIQSNFDKYNGISITVAGRIKSIRTHGILSFIDIKDMSDKIQLYIKEENLKNADHANSELNFSELDLLDTGDFIEGTGIVTKTQRGEISVELDKLKLLTKSLRPMPDEWEGLKDKETRLRRRYLDTNINKNVFDRFLRRAKYWEAHREFFKQNGFFEMNIPILESVTGGADANPFVTHMDALDTDFYLRISQELYLKRLIGGGYEKVFEIGPRFRNEGISDEHLPEHIAMEFYWAYADYKTGMEFTKEMFRYVYNMVYGTLKFNIKGFEVDLSKEWELIDFSEIIKERFQVDIFNTTIEQVYEVLKLNNVRLEGEKNLNRGIDNLWKIIRKTISGPAFLVNEPKFLSPLAKSHINRPEITERFHPLIAGSELGNAFSELNDPIDQYNRFLEQQKLRDLGDGEAQMMDIDFVEMLEYGMPPTFGYGHSERNFWYFEDVPAREGVPFPQMRHEIDEVTKTIYPELNNDFKVDSQIQKNQVQDFSKKAVILIDENIESWQKANTIAHISAYLGNKIHKNFLTDENFITKNDFKLPRNSQYPFVILKASKSQLINLIYKIKDSKLLYHAFIKEMIETTNDNEIQAILNTKIDSDIEYLGIGLFGNIEEINLLTKKFSLYK